MKAKSQRRRVIAAPKARRRKTKSLFKPDFLSQDLLSQMGQTLRLSGK